MGSSGGSSAPSAQQQALEANQAEQQATLDQNENDRRKRLLQATMGTRMFRGSALTTAAGTNTPGGAPSASQQSPIISAGNGGGVFGGRGAAGGDATRGGSVQK